MDDNDHGEVAAEDGPQSHTTPPVEPVEQASIEPVDLRSVDWTGQTWDSRCTEDLATGEVALTRSGGDGTATHDDPLHPFTYTVALEGVAFGDVLGTGAEAAFFVTRCEYPAAVEHALEVWGHDEAGDPSQLAPVDVFSKWDGYIDDLEVVDDRLIVHAWEGLPWDEHPHLHGYPVSVTTQWSYSRDTWRSTELRRDPEHFDGCIDPRGSPEAAARCFASSVQRAAWEVAASVAATGAVDFVRELASDDVLLTGTFTGCGEPRLPQDASGPACFIERGDEFVQLTVTNEALGPVVMSMAWGVGGGDPAAADGPSAATEQPLDVLWDLCAAGDLTACTDLYWASPLDTPAERFGATCGDREPYGSCMYSDR